MVGTELSTEAAEVRRPIVRAGVEAKNEYMRPALLSAHVSYSEGPLHIEVWKHGTVDVHHLTLREPYVTVSFDRDQIEQLHHALGDYLDLLAEDDALRALEVVQ